MFHVLHVLHGLMALPSVGIIMLHVYFALRPEKRLYLRAMTSGGISCDEHAAEYDPQAGN